MRFVWIGLFLAGCGSSPGGLDATFGTNGVVTVDVNSSQDEAFAVAFQSDGKILVAGRTQNTDWDFLVARLETNGTVDTTFGTAGFTVIDFGTADDVIRHLVVSGDDSVLAIGTSEDTTRGTSRFAVAKLTSTGALDATFGTNGKLTTSIGSSPTRAFSGILQSDGKLVVVGETTDGGQLDFALVRYSATGVLDNSFDLDGKLTADFAGKNDGLRSVAQASNGDLIGGGFASDAQGSPGLSTIRLDSDGVLDTNFGTGGFGRVPSAVGARGTTMRLDTQQRIVIGGTVGAALPAPIVVRFRGNDGTLDSSFGVEGQSLPTLPEEETFSVSGVAFAGSSVLVIGSRLGTALNLGALLLSSFGSLNASFGDKGLLEVDLDGGEERGEAGATQSDGKIVAVGSRSVGLDRDLFLTRFQP